ncbi:MAG: LysR substrate-binding domain-containing protein [Gammaproteobacteria bacterium]
MELRHLRHFTVLAEELHFGRAARRLAISQPPLSSSIRQLEEDLGARLFERSSKHVCLTAAGAAFLVEARHILGQAADARALVARIAAGMTGRLQVGFVASMLYRGLPERLDRFQRDHPGIEVVLRELNSGEQIEALRAGRLDAGFVHAPAVPAELDGVEYLAEPFVCCLPEGHPQAGRRHVDLKALAAEPFVVFARDVSPAYYDRIAALCVDAGFTLAPRHEVRHWLTVVALVAAGMGIALVPAALGRAGMAGVRYVPLRNREIRSVTRLLWSPLRMTPALGALIAIVQQEPLGESYNEMT